MDEAAVESLIGEVTGEFPPFDDQEDIVASFNQRKDKQMSLRAFIAAWHGVNCGPVLCAADTADASADDTDPITHVAAEAPSALTMTSPQDTNSEVPTACTEASEDFFRAGVTHPSYLDVQHLVEAAARTRSAEATGADPSSMCGIMSAFDAALAPYGSFGTSAVAAHDPDCAASDLRDADCAADELLDAASSLDAAASVALGGPTPMTDAHHIAPYLRTNMSADMILANRSGAFLTDLYRAARTASGSDEEEDGVTMFDDAKLRATSQRDARAFESAALGLADHLRQTTLEGSAGSAIGDAMQRFEQNLGRAWGAMILAAVNKSQMPYAPQEVMESTAAYTMGVRQSLVRNVVDRGSGAMNHAFEAIMQMASIIATQTAVSLRQRSGGHAYMKHLRTELRDVLAVSVSNTEEDVPASKVGANPFSTRSQLSKGLKTLVDEASVKSPVKAVQRLATLHTNGFLKVFMAKWSSSTAQDKKYYRDTAGLYASGVVGMLIMRDMATLAATYDNLADAWRTSAVPYMITAIRTLQF